MRCPLEHAGDYVQHDTVVFGRALIRRSRSTVWVLLKPAQAPIFFTEKWLLWQNVWSGRAKPESGKSHTKQAWSNQKKVLPTMISLYRITKTKTLHMFILSSYHIIDIRRQPIGLIEVSISRDHLYKWSGGDSRISISVKLIFKGSLLTETAILNVSVSKSQLIETDILKCMPL